MYLSNHLNAQPYPTFPTRESWEPQIEIEIFHSDSDTDTGDK